MDRTVWIVRGQRGLEIGTLRESFREPDPETGDLGENLTNVRRNPDGTLSFGQLAIDHDTGTVTVPWDSFLEGYPGFVPSR